MTVQFTLALVVDLGPSHITLVNKMVTDFVGTNKIL